jgi:hypothetical protein
MPSHPPLTIRPANEASWSDLQRIFGERGEAARCFCQRCYKLLPREAFKHNPPEVPGRAAAAADTLRRSDAETTSGLVAFLDGEPVGWCAVEPRPNFSGLLRVYRVPWVGRAEDKADPGIWAVTCVFVRAGFRHRG